jgi:hypothetical protein
MRHTFEHMEPKLPEPNFLQPKLDTLFRQNKLSIKIQ